MATQKEFIQKFARNHGLSNLDLLTKAYRRMSRNIKFSPDDLAKKQTANARILISAYNRYQNDLRMISEYHSSGDEKLVSDLLEAYESTIRHYIQNNINIPPENYYEDYKILAHRVNIIIFEKLKDFDLERGHLFGDYIKGILKNLRLEYYREKKKSRDRYTTIDQNLPLPNANHPLENLEQLERERVIRSALRKLPDKYSDLIYMKYFEERSIREISQITNLSEGMVRDRLMLARRKLSNNSAMQKLSNFLQNLMD